MSDANTELRGGPVPARAFAAPSPEAGWWLRTWPDLTSPTAGTGSTLARTMRVFLVAPLTQLTVRSFDLQAFLFLVFHRRALSRWGHGVFMTTGVMFLLSGVMRDVDPLLGGHAASLALCAGLGMWYAAVALPLGLRLWLAASLAVLAALWWCATTLAHGPLSPWLGFVASVHVVAWSHIPEERLPPRVGDPWLWLTPWEYLVSADVSRAERARRGLKLLAFFVWGPVNEAWATPRLMPYAWLLVLLRLGYAPELRARLYGWERDAWASGNPAVDYVGVGGGTFVAPPRKN